ncbi:MAG: ATP-binding protein [Thermoplasmata archaeon]|nr:ATP-binding protein [Thermoplasmata archaeon]
MAFRRVFRRYPREAVRELIVNAVVHRDYRKGVPVTVSVHPDRIVIASKGALPEGWTVETLLGDHDSDPRNRTMAEVFHDAGYVENWAQGIRKVVEGCRANGNPDPEFGFALGVLKATIRSATPPGGQASECPIPLTEVQRGIVDLICADPRISASEMAGRLGITERTVQNNIRKLVELGMISREGNNRTGAWKVNHNEG